jgi:hypothetical protein
MAGMLRQALVEELDGMAQVPIKSVLSRRESKFRHSHALRGRLQLFMRPWPDALDGRTRQA